MLNYKLRGQSLDFEENDTVGQGKIWGGGGHFKESAPEIGIEIPLSLLLSTNAVRSEKELPRSYQLNHS